jgi:hypothetical protein
VLLLGVDGTILWVRHNCPGSWNDGDMSYALQLVLCDETIVHPGLKVCGDSAFPVHGDMEGRIITPLKEGDLERYPEEMREGCRLLNTSIISLRQSAEWGMAAVSKVYRQLELRLPYNPEVRGRRLMNMFRLYNFRVRRTGISQIRTHFFSNCSV